MAVKRWSGTAWEVYAGADVVPVKVTDGRPGKTTFVGATTPTGQVDGDIWIDQDTVTNAVVPTALTTKGDIFAATGNAAYSRLAAGNNGESLFADSTTSTGLRWQGDFNTGKNKILNGDFSIWQRGISFTGAGYTTDRWYITYSTPPTTHSITRETFAPGSAPVAGYEGQYYFRRSITSVGSSTDGYLGTAIEDVRTLAGQTATFSFWARSDSTRAINLSFNQVFGTGGSANAVVSGPTFNITNSWQRYTATINFPSLSGKTIGTGSYLNPYFAHTPASGFILDLWGIQLEAGSIATPFTTATGNQALELAACQRYYQRLTPGGSGYTPLSEFALVNATTQITLQVRHAIQMRAEVHTIDFSGLSLYGGSSGGFASVSNVLLTRSSGHFTEIAPQSTGLVVGQFFRIQPNNVSSAYIGFSAEL